MIKPIENIVRVTWKDIKELHPCGAAVEYVNDTLHLSDDDVITQKHLDAVGKYKSEWVDWTRYNLASTKEDLSPTQRFAILEPITGDTYRHWAACNVPGLSNYHRAVLRG